MKKMGLIGVVIVSVFVGLGSLSWAGSGSLPRTGQTTCYDTAGHLVGCAGTGQDGEIGAGVPWPSPRFTDNGNRTITDNLTGLTWLEDANCMKTKYPAFDKDSDAGDGMVYWQSALNFVAGINNGTYPGCGAGYTDWRLPNVNEMESLVHAGVEDPAAWLCEQGFVLGTASFPKYWWTSTTQTGYPSKAFYVDMGSGMVVWGDKYYGWVYVWPVRGTTAGPAQIWKTGQTACYGLDPKTWTYVAVDCAGTGQDGEFQAGVSWPSSRFEVSGDCVTDNLTGLVWTKNANLPNGPRTWQGALDFANSLSLCGYSDWKLPNKKELRSVVNYGAANPATWLKGQGFTNVLSGTAVWYWSSTTLLGQTDGASAMDMGYSFMISDTKDWNGPYVWPVRGGVLSGNADLSVTMTASPNSIRVGELVRYTIQVKNNGPETATGVMLGDTLPPGMILISASDLFYDLCSYDSGTVVCDVGTMNSGDQITVSIDARAYTLGSTPNTAGVDAIEHDPNPGNNLSTATITVDQPEPVHLAKTGQTTCYDASGNPIGCAGTGQDGEIQAGLAWPSPRFIVNGGCITDSLTGLVWLRDADLAYSVTIWKAAMEFAATLGWDELCGHSDWRVPNINELESLVNANEEDQRAWLTGQGFLNLSAKEFWSSTTDLSDFNRTMILNMDDGGVYSALKDHKRSTLAVGGTNAGPSKVWKSGQTTCFAYNSSTEKYEIADCQEPWAYIFGQDGHIQEGIGWSIPRFTVSGDCVTDNLTGLAWTKNANQPGGAKTWQEALDYANSLSLCGFDDWRLPSRKEMRSLFNHGFPENDVHQWFEEQGFTSVQYDYYWTSTTYVYDPTCAFYLDLWGDYGAMWWDDKAKAYSVWPVRGGLPSKIQYSLAVVKAGRGAGRVTSSPAGIDCGLDCGKIYDVDTVVTLAVAADTGSTFVGWSGNPDCSDGIVTMNTAKTCVATFSPNFATLTVSKAGTGSGRVTSAPSGIDCGDDCSEVYAINTVVTLTATADTGSVFAGWSGDPDCSDGVVTMDDNKTCTATFVPPPTLTVNKAGGGSGRVTSVPSGIDCGSDCSEVYALNTVVTLIATADAGSTFTGWSGDPDCSDGAVTMNGSKTCTATFSNFTGLNVRALIDGRSQLIIKGNAIRWHHITWAAPGRHSGANEPTYLNGFPWYPGWPNPGDNGSCNCDSSTYTGIPALPATDLTVAL